MTYRHFKYEGWLYAAAFILALAFRLTQLGLMPLGDIEALPALQALHIAQGIKPALDPHPFYILSTSILFFIFGGGTNFLARLMPALVGSLLVFAPRFFDDRLKPRPSLILAFFIALDPGLAALSRQAASPIFAVTFLLFALAFINKDKPNLAGIFSALALLSGPSIWQGWLGLGIAAALAQGLNSRRSAEDVSVSYFNLLSFLRQPAFLYSFFLAFVVIGTLFFIVPNGLSAALDSIPAFINSWRTISDVSIGRMFLALLIYQPLAISLALMALVRGWVSGSKRVIPLSVWFIVSLLLAIFLPSHQVSDLVWVLIPLYAMAALELARNFDIFQHERLEVTGVILLMIFISIFAWLDFSGLVWIPANTRDYLTRFWLLIGSIFLLGLSLVLVAAGWSARTARFGGVWGLVCVMGIFGLSGLIGSTGMRGLSHPELWWPPSIPMQADLLDQTVRQVSQLGIGNDFSAPVQIEKINSPALEWTLRRREVQSVDSLDSSSSPDLVITTSQSDPTLVAGYRGQDFNWRQTPLWDVATSGDWIRWVVLREMPFSGETIVLWARDDLFLDNNGK